MIAIKTLHCAINFWPKVARTHPDPSSLQPTTVMGLFNRTSLILLLYQDDDNVDVDGDDDGNVKW